MFEDHPKVEFEDFRGLYARGDNKVPPQYSTMCQNCVFTNRNVKLRTNFVRDNISAINAWPFDGLYDFSTTGYHIRMAIEINGLNSPKLIGTYEGKLYYVSGITKTQIWSDVNWDGTFDIVQWNDERVYIMPYLISGFGQLLVYKIGDALARVAGGTAPAGNITLASVAGGIMSAGTYLVAISYETDSGFITKPGNVKNITIVANQRIDVSVIPTGPAGTVARWVLMTKPIATYGGDPAAHEFFFVGRINDNVATTFGINHYVTALVESADYLFDQRDNLPAARGLGIYEGRLIGFAHLEVTGKEIIQIMVSKKNEPESFDAVDGNLLVPTLIGGAHAVAAGRGSLYIFGLNKTLVTQDNGDVPANWPVNLVDDSIGILRGKELFSKSRAIASMFSIPMLIEDSFIILTNAGLRRFSGAYGEELTYNIDDWFDIKNYRSSNPNNLFYGPKVTVNTVTKQIFISDLYASFQSSAGDDMLVGDYSEGLTAQGIKWSSWKFNNVEALIPPFYVGGGFVPSYTRELLVYPNGDTHLVISQTSLGLDFTLSKGFLPVGTSGHRDRRDHIHDRTTISVSSDVVWGLSLPPISIVDEMVNQFTGVVIEGSCRSAIGAGALDTLINFALSGLNGSGFTTIPALTISINNKTRVYRQFNFVNSELLLSLSATQELARSYANSIEISKVTIHGIGLWGRIPQ